MSGSPDFLRGRARCGKNVAFGGLHPCWGFGVDGSSLDLRAREPASSRPAMSGRGYAGPRGLGFGRSTSSEPTAKRDGPPYHKASLRLRRASERHMARGRCAVRKKTSVFVRRSKRKVRVTERRTPGRRGPSKPESVRMTEWVGIPNPRGLPIGRSSEKRGVPTFPAKAESGGLNREKKTGRV